MTGSSNRTWKLVALSALVLLVVVGGGWFAWDRSSRSALDGARTRLAGAGLPVELAEIESWIDGRFGVCPEGENGAPALRAALAAVRELSVPYWDREEGELPTPDEPARAIISEHAEHLDRIARALESPRFRFEIAWQDGLEAETAAWIGYQEALNLSTMQLAIHVEDGALDDALDALRRIAALGETLRECPRLVEQGIRVTIARDSSRYLRRLLERADDPRAVLAAADLEPLVAGIRLGLGTEPATLLDAAHDLMAAGDQPSVGGLLVPWLRRDLAHLVDHVLAVYGAAAPLSGAAITQIERMEADYIEGAGWLGRLLASNTSPWLRLELEQRAELALTRAGAETLAFRDREGRWPTVAELPAAPIDPISGAALTAEADGDDLLLMLGEASWRLPARR